MQELLSSSCRIDIDIDYEIIIYDQCTVNPSLLALDCFLVILVALFKRDVTENEPPRLATWPTRLLGGDPWPAPTDWSTPRIGPNSK